jgi:hypothetical protein
MLFWKESLNTVSQQFHQYQQNWDRRGRDHMAVGFTTTFVISAYHH